MTRSGRSRRGRRNWRRISLVAASVGVVLSLVAYVGVSAYVYNQMGPVTAGCPATEGFVDIQDPTAFVASIEVDGARHAVDTTPYRMPPPQTVHLPSA
jgi:hypothetical protein